MVSERIPLVATVVGTRPEAIKMASLCQCLGESPCVKAVLVSTGQHRTQLDQVFSRLKLTPDVDLKLMHKVGNLNGLCGKVLEEMDAVLENLGPDMVVVQGDTTTAFASGLAAFHRGVPVGHVEAGLRSGDIMNPYPEEANRKFISSFATLNFAPTRQARRNLEGEQVDPESIIVTGNTVVDTLQRVSSQITELPVCVARRVVPGRRIVLVTAHRRESWGASLARICLAVRKIAQHHPDVEVVFPVHKNPVVRQMVFPALSDLDRVHLVEPLDYFEFVSTMKFAALILTDSGGVQEEAPTFGTPVLVMRETTERSEAMEAGTSLLVGTGTEDIVLRASAWLATPPRSSGQSNPFGDGMAAQRILKALLNWYGGRRPYLDQEDFFGR
ncbi:non-hydrolyzing UDP-N-acetylglucosamine 2-epimerase [Pseudodesulfovibrio senegalensis]|jgi:UDP-N-acetylglucosamine 2-epimerase (non-hydrolysing)|uniref:UDP-N-acetylglucosamine 2-epimerase (non-hydrolyzing) n=1 Tax=Pseudodesulfovibrio senegalensis TaxID=1721087 RepID=A0A6N6N1A8_9BACT|nr:UDP-N-acetylglucosamine 2-epimerase (non-hydrolyzing) [Pseudodesulfovibrio senegalensis]KAB1441391.1 UDP-N-acetylglucosamine 2-epimerase (non-hydrolyzing) [Pseudodesulfovibrio senegalensis]